MRQVYLIPNIITAFGLACGLFVIFKVNMIEPGSGTYQLLTSSILLLLVAALADLLDGAVARAFHAESEFGFMFDSLADAVSFGVAPSVLFLKTLSLEQGTGLSFFAVIGAMVFSICGVLRLVRFNIKTNEAKKSAAAMVTHMKHFTGLPIPCGAIAAVAATLLFSSPFGEKFITPAAQPIILTCLMVILGYFMVSRFKFPSVKALHFRVPSFQLVFFTVIFALFVFYGIFYFFPVVLFAVSWSYILLAIVLGIIRKIAGKKSKTLEEFEPEQDDLD